MHYIQLTFTFQEGYNRILTKFKAMKPLPQLNNGRPKFLNVNIDVSPVEYGRPKFLKFNFPLQQRCFLGRIRMTEVPKIQI